MLDVRAAHVLVRIEDVDVLRAGLVRLPRDRTDERRMLDERVDAECLPALEVQADLNGEPRICLESLVRFRHDGRR